MDQATQAAETHLVSAKNRERMPENHLALKTDKKETSLSKRQAADPELAIVCNQETCL